MKRRVPSQIISGPDNSASDFNQTSKVSRMETTSDCRLCSLSSIPDSELFEHFRSYHNITADILNTLSWLFKKDLSGLEKLPDFAKKLIFNYLDMEDLKKLTLMSSKMNLDVKNLDRRFSVLSAGLDRDLTELESFIVKRRNIKISLHVGYHKEICEEELKEKFTWISSQAGKIVHITIDVDADDKNTVKQLLSPDLIFPNLKTVDLSMNSYTSGMVYMDSKIFHNILMKFGSKIEKLNLTEVDFRKFRAQESIQLPSLREVYLKDLPGISRLLEILHSSTQSLQKLEVHQNFEGFFVDRHNLEETLSVPMIKDNFLKLTHLEINCFWNDHRILNLENLLDKCAATLTYLEISDVKTDFNPLSVNFSALKSLIIDGREDRIKTSRLNYLMCNKLEYIKISYLDIIFDTEINIDLELPCLTELIFEDMKSDVSKFLLEILRRAPNLVSFRYDSENLDFSAFDRLKRNFPSLLHVHIWARDNCAREVVSTGRGLNFLLKGCPNLKTLHLCYMKVDFDLKLPHLSNLLLSDVEGKGLNKLISSCASNLEILCLWYLKDTSVILNRAIKRGLPQLKQLNIFPEVQSWMIKLKSSQLPANLQVFSEYFNMGDLTFCSMSAIQEIRFRNLIS